MPVDAVNHLQSDLSRNQMFARLSGYILYITTAHSVHPVFLALRGHASYRGRFDAFNFTAILLYINDTE